ncbi:hypothetical protein OCF56_18830 [Bacillus mycoides]|uniref:AbiTii domain-containing protein n=1 Tax=Bacillus mycoides TaxID=1405 RepID=UPI0021CD495D|nr:hypothetical protein [Bacillus mycoides]MCU5655954.1 hypothetical protein [Bacillus mycoides]
MDSIVLELQREASSGDVEISNLLRKAYIVAKKLKIAEFEEWSHRELNGYSDYDSTPEYRLVQGEIKGYDPYRGSWIPVLIENPKIAKELSGKKLLESISSMESLVNQDGMALVKFPASLRNNFSNSTGLKTEYGLSLNKEEIKGIIETVRNIVLEWALKLEEDGILGENMSFSKEEKEMAQSQSYTTNNFYASVSDTQIQQHTNNSSQVMQNKTIDLQKVNELLKNITDNIGEFNLKENEREIVDLNLKMVEQQSSLPSPNPVLIKECFSTVRNILEGVTGSLVASGIIYHLGLFLS